MLDTKQLILFVHKFVITQSKELDGLQNPEALESVAKNIFQSFDGLALYPTIEDKASFLAYGIIKDHIFKNGNKRTAVGVMLQFLKYYGISISCTQQELINLGLNIATSTFDKHKIVNWILEHEK